MAARSLEVGSALMRAQDPAAFANIAAADRIVTANREAMEACRKRTNRAREAVRCTVIVEADQGRR